jgi:hypothetical protein
VERGIYGLSALGIEAPSPFGTSPSKAEGGR